MTDYPHSGARQGAGPGGPYRPLACSAALLLALSGPALGELHDRGGGLIYDDVLDVTWLQDANYALTSGAHPSGRVSYATATRWAETLVYYDALRDVLWGDWRLPRTLPVNGASYVHEHREDGSSDVGFNIASPQSELGYHFHVNLDGLSYSDVDSNWPQPNYGLQPDQVGPFVNLGPYGFWSETEYADFDGHAWGFIFMTGSQHHGTKTLDQFIGWPVRDGDVAAGPIPNLAFLTLRGGQSVSGTIGVRVGVENMTPRSVTITAAEQTLCTDNQSPFVCVWNTAGLANGSYFVRAKAVDANGNGKVSQIIVEVNN